MATPPNDASGQLAPSLAADWAIGGSSAPDNHAASDDGRSRGRRIHVELLGVRMRANGSVSTEQFPRLSDYVNVLDGFCLLHDVQLTGMTATTDPIGVPELHVKLDEVALIAQLREQPRPVAADYVVAKRASRLLLVTESLAIAGTAYLHLEGSLDAFLDATDPRFIPLTDADVRLLSGEAVGIYPFVLVQRRHLIGVASIPASQEPLSEAAAS